MPFVRPDGRSFVRSPDEEVAGGDLYAMVSESDSAAYERAGYTFNRREYEYVVPTRTIGSVAPPAGILIVRADMVDVDRLRQLDDELRQDVPGTDGWRWDAAAFRSELDSPQFDPEVYVVAVDGGSYVGIARVWLRDPPRLGFVGVSRSHRRRGVARALLSRVFDVLVERGVEHVTTEIDELNIASRALIEPIGARRVGTNVELVKSA